MRSVIKIFCNTIKIKYNQRVKEWFSTDWLTEAALSEISLHSATVTVTCWERDLWCPTCLTASAIFLPHAPIFATRGGFERELCAAAQTVFWAVSFATATGKDVGTGAGVQTGNAMWGGRHFSTVYFVVIGWMREGRTIGWVFGHSSKSIMELLSLSSTLTCRMEHTNFRHSMGKESQYK